MLIVRLKRARHLFEGQPVSVECAMLRVESARDVEIDGLVRLAMRLVEGSEAFIELSREICAASGILATWVAGAEHRDSPGCFWAVSALRDARGTHVGALWLARRSRGTVSPPEQEVLDLVGAQIVHLLAARRASAEMRRETFSLRALMESSHDVMVSADSHGRISAWNAASGAMFGYSAREIIGQPLTVLMPERYRSAHGAGLKRVHAEARSALAGQLIELVAVRRDGTEFPVEMSLSTWGEGEERSFGAVIRDITERRRTAQATADSQARLAAMVEGLPAGAVYIEGDLLSMNRAAEIMTGNERNELTSVSAWFRAVYGDTWHEVYALNEQDRQAGFIASRRVTLRRKDGWTSRRLSQKRAWAAMSASSRRTRMP